MSADDLIPLVRASLLATAREYNLPAVIRSLELNDWRRAKEGFDEAVTSEHEAAHACYALATCEHANAGRTRLLAETIRRANAVGALAKKLHGERYRRAVREARGMGVL